MNNDFNSIRKFIQENRDIYINLQRMLTSIPAIAPNNGGDGEIEKCTALTEFLINHGINNLKRFNVPDARVKSGIRPNLLATIEGESDDYSIWVIAHMDVVPEGDLSLWDSDPWTVIEKDGILIGRGVEDNQQGLVVGVAAALAFIGLDIKPKHSLKLLFVADEENGSKYGIEWILNNTNLFNPNDLILIPDGGDSLGETIEISEKTTLWLELTILGKQAHGSAPNEGINASLVGSHLAITLNEKLMERFNKENPIFSPCYSTFEPTMHKLNLESVNIIPGKDVFYMDCRILPCYTSKDILNAVDDICKSIEDEFNVKIKYDIVNNVESATTSKDANIVTVLSNALKEVHGIDAKTVGVGGQTVATLFRNFGFDCVVWSTLLGDAHMPNERCLIENMIKDAETLAYIIYK